MAKQAGIWRLGKEASKQSLFLQVNIVAEQSSILVYHNPPSTPLPVLLTSYFMTTLECFFRIVFSVYMLCCWWSCSPQMTGIVMSLCFSRWWSFCSCMKYTTGRVVAITYYVVCRFVSVSNILCTRKRKSNLLIFLLVIAVEQQQERGGSDRGTITCPCPYPCPPSNLFSLMSVNK